MICEWFDLKTTWTVSSGLASKPAATVFASLASKLVVTISLGLASKPVVVFFLLGPRDVVVILSFYLGLYRILEGWSSLSLFKFIF
jgi:hypothetical protein